MLKHKLVDFIIQFMEEVDKEISEMKLFVRYSYYSTLPDHDLRISVERQSKIRCRVFLDSCKTLPLPVCYSKASVSGFGAALHRRFPKIPIRPETITTSPPFLDGY
jgi:hypothetical protein